MIHDIQYTYSNTMLYAMTPNELIRGLENGAIDNLNSELILRIIDDFRQKSDKKESDYDDGYNDGVADGRKEGIDEAIAVLQNL